MGWQPEDTSGDSSIAPSAHQTLRHDQSAYIAEMTGELRGMATSAGLEFIAHLLAMAEEEAREESRRRRHSK